MKKMIRVFSFPVVAIVLALTLSCSTISDARQSIDKEELRQVLQQNPELVLDVLRGHETELYEMVMEGMRAKRQEETDQRIAFEREHPLEPEIDPSRPVLGNPVAPHTIVVYSDFLCLHCAEAAHTLHELVARHPSEVRVFFKHFLRAELSYVAALYYEAVALQDPSGAWQFHDVVMDRQEELRNRGPEMLEEIAAELDLDMTRLHGDLQDPVLAQRITRDVEEAEKSGFSGTPVLVVDGVSIREAVSLEELEESIDFSGPGTAGEQSP